MAALDGQDAPPNSLEAIRACLEAKAAYIEIDVTALADGDYLLVHDPMLESETTGSGEVGNTALVQAQALYFRRDGVVTEYRVPVLSEVVALFQQFDTPTRLQIDFKNMIPLGSDEPLQRLLTIIEPLQKRVIVSTGADWQLRKLRQFAPWLDLGFDIGFYLDFREPSGHPLDFPHSKGAYGYLDDHPTALMKLWTTADYLADRCGAFVGLVPGVSVFYISYKLLIQSLDDGFNWAEVLHAAGIKLDAWTVDVGNPYAESSLPRLVESGVDFLTTNTPQALAALLMPVPPV
jgi:glycerophosphoryl diester phosphodiesterase